MAKSEKKVTEQVTEEVKSEGGDMKVTPKAKKARGNGSETEFMIIIVGTKTVVFIFKIFFINVAINPGIKSMESEKKHISKIF